MQSPCRNKDGSISFQRLLVTVDSGMLKVTILFHYIDRSDGRPAAVSSQLNHKLRDETTKDTKTPDWLPGAVGAGNDVMWIPASAGKTRVGAGHSRLSASAIIHYPTAVGFNPQFLNLCSRSE